MKRHDIREAPGSTYRFVGHAYDFDVYKLKSHDVATGFITCDRTESASHRFNWTYFDIDKDGNFRVDDYDVPSTFAHHIEIVNLFNEEKD